VQSIKLHCKRIWFR